MTPADLAGAPPARLPFPVIRAQPDPVEVRAEGGSEPPTMFGHFSTFGDFYEVDSLFEGRFLESIQPGAFRKTFRESRGQMKVTFNHGQDPTMGDQVLGSIEKLSEDAVGAAYEVPLFPSVPPLIVDGLRAGVYGSSFRFSVEKDSWDQSPERSKRNPDGIPERTITEARVYEFGPVTYPANPSATAGVRSTTDDFYRRSRDPEGFETLLRSAQSARTPAPAGAATPPPEPPASTPPEPLRSDTPPAAVPAAEAVTPEVETRTVEYTTPEERASRITELKDILSRQAIEFPGVLPSDAQATWDANTGELQTLQRDAAAWEERQSFLVRNASRPETAVPPTYSPPAVNVVRRLSETDIYDVTRITNGASTPEARDQMWRDYAMRSVETAYFPHPDAKPDECRTHIANLLDHKDSRDKELARRILVTGSPIYRRYFNKHVIGLPLSPEEQRAAALQVIGTTTTGGDAVPYTFDPTLIHTGAYTSINPYRAACRVEQIVGSNVWTGVSVGAIVAAYAAESATASEQGPTFAAPSFTVRRAHTFVTLSDETMDDRSDIAAELASLISEAKDTLEENKFAVGAGNPAPAGMLVKSNYTVKVTVGNEAFAVEDLAATEAVLPIRHRMRAAWFFGRGIIRKVQGWETIGGELFASRFGYPAVGELNNYPTGNTGLRLLGYPVWETPSANITCTNDLIVGILVDPKSYIIVDRIGMSVEVIPHLFNQAVANTATGLPTGDRGLYARWRNTGGVLNVDAGRQINIQ